MGPAAAVAWPRRRTRRVRFNAPAVAQMREESGFQNDATTLLASDHGGSLFVKREAAEGGSEPLGVQRDHRLDTALEVTLCGTKGWNFESWVERWRASHSAGQRMEL